MAVSPQIFPARKRRPSAGAFITPKLSGRRLLHALLVLSQEISALNNKTLSLFKRNSRSIIRKANLLSIVFQEIVSSDTGACSSSAMLCFEEMYVVLQRIKTLLEDISHGSRTWTLFQNDAVSSSFWELTAELSTVLDVFPEREFGLSGDVSELVRLVRRQSSRADAAGYNDDRPRLEVVGLLDGIRNGVVPESSDLERIFRSLGISDSARCKEEMESLDEELQSQSDDGSRSDLIALTGLVRYARCVLFGSSRTSVSTSEQQPGRIKSFNSNNENDGVSRSNSINSEVTVPPDFRCPITLELMRDPVVVSTGQTYDRDSIAAWIDSGHTTCPKTGQTLSHTELIPNLSLRSLIAMWCRHHKIPFDAHPEGSGNRNANGAPLPPNKAASEATRMTVSFLVNKLSVYQAPESAAGVLHELRSLAKTVSDSRSCMGEIGTIPMLVRFLGSESPDLQIDAVTTILNLSILEGNKARIMETDGPLNGVIEVLRSGATWEAKGNAAATIFSLTLVHAYRKRLGRKSRVIKGLLDLAKSGSAGPQRDAMAAVLNLAGDRETVGRLLEAGVVEAVEAVMGSLPEEAVAVLEAVVKRGGMVGVEAAYQSVRRLGALMREGSETARESTAATLVTMCRKGGVEMVEEMARIPGIERSIWEMMGSGTARGKRKAASLSRILRRWAAGLVGEFVELSAAAASTTTTAALSSTSSAAMLAS